MGYYWMWVLMCAIGGILSIITGSETWFYSFVIAGFVCALTEFFGDVIKLLKEQKSKLDNMDKILQLLLESQLKKDISNEK